MEVNKLLIINRLDAELKEKVINGVDPRVSIDFEGTQYTLYDFRGLINENQREYGENPMAFGPGFNNFHENYPPLKPTKNTIRKIEYDNQEDIEFGKGVANVQPIENPMDKIFIPTWDNRPPEHPPVLLLNGIGVLTWQNLSALIAAQGMGKSSNCEAILASFLNPECDALGWQVDQSITGVIYLDFERTNTDVWNSFYRMARRAKIPYGADISKVVLVGMRSIPRLEQRKEAIIKLLENNPWCKLLVMDGAGDLITDSNDLPQAIECRIWIRELTVKYQLSIFTTLHPNPNSLKPRGHIGSEIMREAEAVMAIEKSADLRVIRSEFEHGKNRNGAPIWGAYAWDDDEKMMCAHDVPEHFLFGDGRQKKKVLAKPEEFDDEFHIKLLHDLFSEEKEFNAGKYHKRLKEVWNSDLNGNMAGNRQVEFKSYHIQQDFITCKPGAKAGETIHYLSDKYLYPDWLFNDLSG